MASAWLARKVANSGWAAELAHDLGSGGWGGHSRRCRAWAARPGSARGPSGGVARPGGEPRPAVGLQWGPRERMMRPPVPEQAPALAMPAQHSLGPDQEEMASPVPEDVADEQPEELVSGAKAGPALAPEGD